MKRVLRSIGLSLLLTVYAALAQQPSYDLLIKNGRVLDGTGNPWFYADVAVKDGKIAAIGKLDGARATRTIDAKGQYVVPGFIDIHSHADNGPGTEAVSYRWGCHAGSASLG